MIKKTIAFITSLFGIIFLLNMQLTRQEIEDETEHLNYINLSINNQLTLNSILPYEVDGDFYLFLPHWATNVFINGLYEQQVPINRQSQILYQERTMYITPMRGSQIPTIFIHTASGSLDDIHNDINHREQIMILFVDEYGFVEYRGGGGYKWSR